MGELSITEARDELAEVVNRVHYGGERTYLTRHGKRIAAIVPVDFVAAYEDLERRADLLAAREAHESDDVSLSWEQVKSQLPQPDPSLVHLQTELRRARAAVEVDVDEVAHFSPSQAVDLLADLAATQRELAVTQERFAAALGSGRFGSAPAEVEEEEASAVAYVDES
jgi:prevent-host-death family protein